MSKNDSFPPEFLGDLEVSVHNSRSVLAEIEENPIRYVGSNHYSLSKIIHAYQRFDLFDGLSDWVGKLSASGYEAVERFVLKTISIIREEIDRLEADSVSSISGTPNSAVCFRAVWVSQALFLCTAERIRRVTKVLKESTLPKRDRELLDQLSECILSKDIASHARMLFGLRCPAGSPIASSLHRVKRMNRNARRQIRPLRPYSEKAPVRQRINSSDIESFQDAHINYVSRHRRAMAFRA